MFGSVPLRTYLPDGDIDLSVFCSQETAQSIRDSWAVKLQSVIEHEQSRGNAPYKIGDVTVINAEVRKHLQQRLMVPASKAVQQHSSRVLGLLCMHPLSICSCPLHTNGHDSLAFT
jgi:hypothetical protein